MNQSVNRTPFEILARYERLSLAHASDTQDKFEAPGLWRGIGFRVGSRYLVSSINEVNEILTLPQLTVVPGTRGWLLGVANVRGNLVPVIDLKQYLEGERSVLTDTSRVLLVRQLGGSVGLLIDEVLGQRSFSEEQRRDAVGEENEHYARFVAEKYPLGDVVWGQFSMNALVRTPDFVQAAA